ncbi:MAG: hypothetical protein HW403_123 [Dehalococcoidia bacterium]|nr:hypothetical protein [Dehalococcoidia bacterium]
MPDYGIIDTHMHCHQIAAVGLQAQGGTSRTGYAGTMEELLPYMAEKGIDKVCMVNFTPVWDMMRAANARLPQDLTPDQRREKEDEVRQAIVGRLQRRNDWSCQVVGENPGKLYAYIGVDPVMGEEEMYQEVHRCKAMGASGIKLHTVVQRLAINDRGLWPAYRAMEELGMTWIMHSGPFRDEDKEGRYGRPALAVDVLKDFPRSKIHLAHCGGRTFFQEAIALAKEYPQLSFDCCGILRDTEQSGEHSLSDDEAVSLFRALGADRVTFGSDWPFADGMPDVERVERLPLTRDEKRNILRDNAIRLLGL